MRKIAALVALLVLATMVLAACGGESGAPVPTAITGGGGSSGGVPTPAPEAPTPTAGTIPACAGPLTPIPLPVTLPDSFPLPPGTVMTTRNDTSTSISISGVAPMDAKSVSDFYTSQLPLSGFKQTKATSGSGTAQATWTGQGTTGTWTAEDIQGCAGASKLTIKQGGS